LVGTALHLCTRLAHLSATTGAVDLVSMHQLAFAMAGDPWWGTLEVRLNSNGSQDDHQKLHTPFAPTL
jgi:hypothetical protein